ncbi:hypothetical protein [Carboxydothermus hydrogenoformans]|uniref:Conserved domain protein n=1 Tax=Carboxydothermus hydrogenoformans (strain ATCC BAA-161 / DSM 6008 / Z-2901) TaxID=246194 RepID=Q3AA71_CARHZ|nr:hypothetical protein [Carboxydothermus hydrogenoformans]ABB15838.1 conserved domain protein [Carboxydothermus hydrogenoformans Z-2901]
MEGGIKKIDELDVVRTKDGREGTVVHVFDVKDLPKAYEVEFGDGELETIEEDKISEVVWRIIKHSTREKGKGE